MPRLSFAAILFSLGLSSVACGGSSSETPYPLEPAPHPLAADRADESGAEPDRPEAASEEEEFDEQEAQTAE